METVQQLMEQVSLLFPNAILDQDESGELVIATGYRMADALDAIEPIGEAE